jgi:hypothetical protein
MSQKQMKIKKEQNIAKRTNEKYVYIDWNNNSKC